MAARERDLDGRWATHREVRRRGGVVTHNQFAGEDREVLSYSERIVQRTRRDLEGSFGWDLERLDFFFLGSPGVNAVVLRSQERHGVGLHVGLPLTLYENRSWSPRQLRLSPELYRAAGAGRMGLSATGPGR